MNNHVLSHLEAEPDPLQQVVSIDCNYLAGSRKTLLTLHYKALVNKKLILGEVTTNSVPVLVISYKPGITILPSVDIHPLLNHI